MFLGPQDFPPVVKVAALAGLPARDVNDLGRAFPGSTCFPAPEPDPPQLFAA
jgi:hypothetical protein